LLALAASAFYSDVNPPFQWSMSGRRFPMKDRTGKLLPEE
jgi:hypothetical protein